MNELTKEDLEIAKKISHDLWQPYDDTHGYRTEKQTRNAEVSTENPDNIWFFWGQFDSTNQTMFLIHAVESGNEALVNWCKAAMAEVQEALEFLRTQQNGDTA
jgi:hypothetical protein